VSPAIGWPGLAVFAGTVACIVWTFQDQQRARARDACVAALSRAASGHARVAASPAGIESAPEIQLPLNRDLAAALCREGRDGRPAAYVVRRDG
jgi:hypothetical protein